MPRSRRRGPRPAPLRLSRLVGRLEHLDPVAVRVEGVEAQVPGERDALGPVDQVVRRTQSCGDPVESGDVREHVRVLTDLGAITNAVDTVGPGGADVSELWLEVAPGAQSRVDASVSRRPFWRRCAQPFDNP